MAQTYDSADSPVWMLRSFDMARRQAISALFARLPLHDPAQHFALFALECAHRAGDTPSQGEIARQLQRSPATMTATLRSLEKLGLLQRRQDELDQRKNRVEITREGLEMAERCRSCMDTLEEAMFRGFSPEELEQLSGFFTRMCRNLSGIEKEETDT